MNMSGAFFIRFPVFTDYVIFLVVFFLFFFCVFFFGTKKTRLIAKSNHDIRLIRQARQYQAKAWLMKLPLNFVILNFTQYFMATPTGLKVRSSLVPSGLNVSVKDSPQAILP